LQPPCAASNRDRRRQNADPLPVSTTILVAPSTPSPVNASVSKPMTVSSMALRTFGRLIVTVATPRASLAMRTGASLI